MFSLRFDFLLYFYSVEFFHFCKKERGNSISLVNEENKIKSKKTSKKVNKKNIYIYKNMSKYIKYYDFIVGWLREAIMVVVVVDVDDAKKSHF